MSELLTPRQVSILNRAKSLVASNMRKSSKTVEGVCLEEITQLVDELRLANTFEIRCTEVDVQRVYEVYLWMSGMLSVGVSKDLSANHLDSMHRAVEMMRQRARKNE